MAKKHVRKRRRRNRFLPAMISILCVVAAVLAVAIVINETRGSGAPDVAVMNGKLSPSPTGGAASPTSDYGLTLAVQSYSTPAPTPRPTQEPTAAPTPSPEYEYLPVYSRGSKEKRQIAITVDDCYQTENLDKIVTLANSNKGKLTLFPIGENVMREGLMKVLRKSVFEYGFEIGNHTWSHSRIFRLSDDQMAQEIWKQSIAVSYALGAEYHQNFFRLMGGDGENDQRTDNYLRQLGYKAIANWSYSGSNADIDSICKTLSPGMIYLFHTTDEDLTKLRQFIPYAVSQGYELVTLSEMFGLGEIEITQPTTPILNQVLPTPRPYTEIYRDLSVGDYSWSVVQLQRRLMELGYLGDDAKTATAGSAADGVYGDSTSAAVSLFQYDCGMLASGVADVATQELLFAEDAPRNGRTE